MPDSNALGLQESSRQQDGSLCSCGYPDGSFACRIRHISMNTGDAKAARDVTPVKSRHIESNG